jgi:hypothetical protein
VIHVFAVAAVLAVSAVVGAKVTASPVSIHRGCPAHFASSDLRTVTADEAVAVARRVALEHVVEHNQGRATRRTRSNYPVIEVVSLGHTPALPGQSALAKQAAHRCGRQIARRSWAVVFTDTESVLCCIRDARFVVRLGSGWWVY